ncbi:hypothetical protein BJY01DRAFT_247910 [Aspergillus pseudoustus]|uniref:Xylanolytic transcriptional activator regulatory domain-containing protein n=1 Tax=Aspergillus pseudoustus TaxID=1810923 RepID=A0ABR4JY66_9EURO
MATHVSAPVNSEASLPWAHPTSNFGDFDLFIDSMGMPYTNDLSGILPLSPSPLFGNVGSQSTCAAVPETTTIRSSVPYFDEFSSTFPLFEPPSSARSGQEPWKLAQQDWNHLLAAIHSFSAVIPAFSPPSRHTMTRYLATYFSGFHRHLPFLHLPTFSPVQCPVELLLAMAAIGAQSAFDNDNAVMFFRASHAIVMGHLRCRKDELCRRTFPASYGESQVLDSQRLEDSSSGRDSASNVALFDPLPAVQTLLLLMAIATWGNSNAIYNEAIGLQNTLTRLVREERLLERQTEIPRDITWHQWIVLEGFKRTMAIVFCFFIFHTIVYDIPPPILNSELNIHLPSREKVWAARSEKEWCESWNEPEVEQPFQSAFSSLFTKRANDGIESLKGYSSLGGYTLVLALIQHIYFLREISKYKSRSEQNISPTDMAEVEQALRNWQSAWYTDPESSFSPGSPQGPISFNSTALLRMAYIRLTVNVGPWRALNTHDPNEIANSIHQSPGLEPTHKLNRAVLYSAHALSIPVKIGVNIVARNQAFTWSLQHALCALECAFVLSKWLIAMHSRGPGVPLDEEESRLLAYIVDMVVEADPGFRSANDGAAVPHLPDLCARVIQIWAKLLSGEAVWDVVRMIGKALDSYSQILKRQPALG